VQEAIRLAEAEGLRVGGMAPKMVWPVPVGQIEPFLRGKREVLVAEVNYTGQFRQLLSARLGRPFGSINVYSGEAFRVVEILDRIRACAGATARQVSRSRS
jgi:2-oxoglutarate ferredoxin oxidoreductase subunit alpha